MPGQQPSDPPAAGDDARVHAFRRFNRCFTKVIGVLHESLLDSGFSLAEVRVLYELAHRDVPTATELCEELGIDAGYMSRIVRRLAAESLVTKRRSDTDGRAQRLALTARGRKTFAKLDRRQHEQVAAMLGRLGTEEQDLVIAAMGTIEAALGGERGAAPPYVLRAHRPGDMGWVIWRHGTLYAEEHGWDDRFEALVAEIVVQFMRDFDAHRDRCWIAERDGRNVGSVFLVKESATVARLRLLLVEPQARGLGIGRHLVEECIRTARSLGYRTLTLWTNDVLHAARRIYQAAGFRLVREEAHHSYGHDLVGQHWELDLTAAAPPRMDHYLLFYEAAEDYERRRESLRQAHLEHAWRAHGRGELVLAGALADPIDGAVLVFRGSSPAVAERFAESDPYVRGGLVQRWHVRPWTTVVGADAAQPLRPEQAGRRG